MRKGPDGNDVNLVPIFESIDTSAFKAVADAIQAQNSAAFAAAYRETLQACYGCHKASGKPYLRPMVPTRAGAVDHQLRRCGHLAAVAARYLVGVAPLCSTRPRYARILIRW